MTRFLVEDRVSASLIPSSLAEMSSRNVGWAGRGSRRFQIEELSSPADAGMYVGGDTKHRPVG